MPCMRKALCARSRQQQTRKDEDHMKKFLSLLLALTLVLSLVVVPARADGDTLRGVSLSSNNLTLEVGASTGNELTVNASSLTYGESEQVPSDATVRYVWSSSDSTVATVAQKAGAGNENVGVITALKKSASSITISCAVTYSWTATKSPERAAGSATATLNCSLTVNDNAGDLRNAITSVTYNSREYYNSTSKSVAAYKFSEDASDTWVVTATGYTVNPVSFDSTTGLTITATKDSGGGSVTATVPCTLTTVSVTVTAKPTTVEKDNGTATLTATATAVPGATITYEWKNSGTLLTGSTATLLLVKPSADASITCKAIYHFSGNVTKTVTTTSETPVTVDSNTYTWSGVPKTTLNMAKGDTNTTTLPAIKLVTSGTTNEPKDVAYFYVSSNPSAVTVIDNSDGSKAIKAVGSGYATITITAKDKTATDALYRGVLRTAEVKVSSTALEYSLGSVTNGSGAHPYSYDTLRSYAASVINARLGNGSNLRYNDVTGLTIKSSSATALGGVFSPATGTLTSAGLTYTAPNATIGKASITLTAATARGNFDIAYTISVTPISTTFETVTAEPITSSSTYYNNTYRVTFPTTSFNQFYVVNKTGVAPTDYSSYNLVAGTTSTTLNASDFNATTGTCTLFVIAWNSNYNYNYNWTTGYTGKYYCGPMTVTQTNYNIQYNGVAGETVQFAQSDFTDFMNEVAEARGDASKTKSYPYVTFDYVTFSLPTTAQGTLYYGGTAMSTSNSSGAFNTRTKVTNLDSVTFVPNAKTTAKTITLNFTLYATRYSSSSTSHGTTVPYSGTVVINLVREDIKYTVSQGDSVRFDESDFLSYLRSTKGYTSNYTIDYVTFDQSAVSAVNEGSLYTYYNGYNYGGSVKTTDKFYYSATASQNALSDVAFLASRYAKTGETVYIPFTIYARYGTTGTGTRQLTGTVAIKIGQTMNFIDVKTTDYFYNSVKWAVGKNITNGTSSTTFSPYKSCTRAEIVTFLWRAAGSPEPTITRNPFRDVNAVTHSSYYKAILWASQKGITSGTSATAFSPDQVCTRAQIVTFLYRYAGQPSGYYSNPFKDVGATSEASYYNAILWAVGKGITTGTSATTFSPYASCNRAEAVTFLYRYTNGL